MSEPAPETAPRSGSGNPFTRRLGPLPVWAWMGIAMALALAYWYYRNKIKGGSSSSGTSTTDQNLVPQFVNQVYTNTTPPDDDDGKQKTERLRREWTASATASTLAQVGGRLGVTNPAKNLIPANPLAQKFMEAYKKNKNAKIPKGAMFYYYEGQVVDVGS